MERDTHAPPEVVMDWQMEPLTPAGVAISKEIADGALSGPRPNPPFRAMAVFPAPDLRKTPRGGFFG